MMMWFKVWFGMAALMLVLLILTHASFQTLGLCFLAWCGGIVFTRMVQEYYKSKQASPIPKVIERDLES